MTATEAAARIGPYVERLSDNGYAGLIDNRYAERNLREAAGSLRAAYDRASKRRVKISRDGKLRRHARNGALSLTEAANALITDRRKPRKRWGRRILILLGLGAVGAVAALATSEGRRTKLATGEPDAAVPTPQPNGAPLSAAQIKTATRAELYQEATRRQIAGRSKMSKSELQSALSGGAKR